MIKRDIPKELIEVQSSKRLETVGKVQDAINDINHEGGVVTKNKLMQLTGLANATFSKPHVIEVLKTNMVCQFKKTSKINDIINVSPVDQLYKRIESLKKENNLLRSKIQDKEIAMQKRKEEYQELKNRYSIILGKIHLLMKKVDMYGIDLGVEIDDL